MNAEHAGGVERAVRAPDERPSGALVRAGDELGPRELGRVGAAWHTLRRAVGFSYYGLLGLAIGGILLPLYDLRARGRGRLEPRDLWTQRAIHRASRSFLYFSEHVLGLIRVRWSGLERLAEHPAVIVANHPSLIDTPILTSQLPQVDLVVSPDWGESFFFRGATAGANYLRADRGVTVVRRAVERVRVGRWLAIYPEGSRTPPEGLRPFYRGAAHVALASGVDLLPIVIRVTPRTLMKGQTWTHIPERTPEWQIEVGERIRPADHLDGSESRPVAARRLTAILQEYFEKRWSGEDG